MYKTFHTDITNLRSLFYLHYRYMSFPFGHFFLNFSLCSRKVEFVYFAVFFLSCSASSGRVFGWLLTIFQRNQNVKGFYIFFKKARIFFLSKKEFKKIQKDWNMPVRKNRFLCLKFFFNMVCLKKKQSELVRKSFGHCKFSFNFFKEKNISLKNVQMKKFL